MPKGLNMDPRPMPLAVLAVLALRAVLVLAVVVAVVVAGFCSEGSAAGCISSGSTDRPPGIPSFTGLKLGGNVTFGVTVTRP